MGSIVGNGLGDLGSNSGQGFFISLGTGMNPTILPPALGK